jgi:hypothetical protein
LKFISDPKNHLLVGNPTAGRLRRLIVVQIKIRLICSSKGKDHQPANEFFDTFSAFSVGEYTDFVGEYASLYHTSIFCSCSFCYFVVFYLGWSV